MTDYTTDRLHVLRGSEPVLRRPTGHAEDVPHGAVEGQRSDLLDLVRDAWPRIERMGVDAIAQAHAAGQPDGTRHVETRSADEVTVTRPAPVAATPRAAAHDGEGPRR